MFVRGSDQAPYLVPDLIAGLQIALGFIHGFDKTLYDRQLVAHEVLLKDIHQQGDRFRQTQFLHEGIHHDQPTGVSCGHKPSDEVPKLHNSVQLTALHLERSHGWRHRDGLDAFLRVTAISLHIDSTEQQPTFIHRPTSEANFFARQVLQILNRRVLWHHDAAHGGAEGESTQENTLGPLAGDPEPIVHNYIHGAALQRHFGGRFAGKRHDVKDKSSFGIQTEFFDDRHLPIGAPTRQDSDAQVWLLRRGTTYWEKTAQQNRQHHGGMEPSALHDLTPSDG